MRKGEPGYEEWRAKRTAYMRRPDQRKKQKLYDLQNRERRLENGRKWRAKNRDRMAEVNRRTAAKIATSLPLRIGRLLHMARLRAKDSGITYCLGKSEFARLMAQTTCAVTGCEFVLEPAKSGKQVGYSHPMAPSIDRINPKRGYVKGNVRVVCVWFNLAKNRWTDAEFRDALKKGFKGLRRGGYLH